VQSVFSVRAAFAIIASQTRRHVWTRCVLSVTLPVRIAVSVAVARATLVPIPVRVGFHRAESGAGIYNSAGRYSLLTRPV
jgi:hypothetical protein